MINYSYIYQMKIIKRLPLMATVVHRSINPKPKDSLMERWYFTGINQYKMTAEQQILKYGFIRKPKLNGKLLVVGILAGFCGFFVHLYQFNLYKNQMTVRDKYRVQQIEHSSIKLRVRTTLFKIGNLAQKNLFSAQILTSNQGKNVVLNSEAILRTQQYRNYMKNRDEKFQFLDIGVMEKYPFPDILKEE